MSDIKIQILVFLFVLWIPFSILGIYYLVIGNAYATQFTGTLIKADVNTVTSCSKKSCSQTYYVEEIFTKDNSTNTCSIQRLIPYYFKGQANNVALSKKLGTTRTIWTTYYSSGTCYDQSIRDYYNKIGGCFLGFFVLLFIEVIISYFTNKTENKNEFMNL